MRAFPVIWAFPATAIGLVLATLAVATGGRIRAVDGVIEASGGVLPWILRRLPLVKGGASALTLGHVVLATDQKTLDRTRRHERAHVRQYERWGLFLIPAYLLVGLWLMLRRRDAYFDNPFEQDARNRDR